MNILEEANELIFGERAASYGDANKNLGRIAEAGIESCSTCALGRVSSGKMPGWYNCSHMRSYEYNSPRAQCFYTPSRYVAKKAAIVAEKAA